LLSAAGGVTRHGACLKRHAAVARITHGPARSRAAAPCRRQAFGEFLSHLTLFDARQNLEHAEIEVKLKFS
jgi:hypothetical protein